MLLKHSDTQTEDSIVQAGAMEKSQNYDGFVRVIFGYCYELKLNSHMGTSKTSRR